MLEIVLAAALIAGVLAFLFSNARQKTKVEAPVIIFNPRPQAKPDFYPGKNRGKDRPPITSEMKKLIAKRYAGKCGFTGQDLNLPGYHGRLKCEFDHIIWHDGGGPTEIWNLMPICREINQAKKHHVTFFARELAYQLGKTIGDENGIIKPYDDAEREFLTLWRMRKERGEPMPEPRPHWLIMANGDPILLRDFEIHDGNETLKGLAAQERYLDFMASRYHQNNGWRTKSKQIKQLYFKQIARESL